MMAMLVRFLVSVTGAFVMFMTVAAVAMTMPMVLV
jgi:hypothetical protein